MDNLTINLKKGRVIAFSFSPTFTIKSIYPSITVNLNNLKIFFFIYFRRKSNFIIIYSPFFENVAFLSNLNYFYTVDLLIMLRDRDSYHDHPVTVPLPIVPGRFPPSTVPHRSSPFLTVPHRSSPFLTVLS